MARVFCCVQETRPRVQALSAELSCNLSYSFGAELKVFGVLVISAIDNDDHATPRNVETSPDINSAYTRIVAKGTFLPHLFEEFVFQHVQEDLGYRLRF